MSIDGFDFNTIVNGRIDPDSPLDTTLFNDMRDQSEFLKRWLGKSFVGAAVADHDHDGVNSKAIISDDIVGSLVDSSAALFFTSTSTASFSVNIAHGLGRTPSSVFGSVVIDQGSAGTMEFEFHWKSGASEVEGKRWASTFGDQNEHPINNFDASSAFSHSSLSNDGIANDGSPDVSSPPSANETWKVTVDATNIILTCTAPTASTDRFFMFKVL